MLKLYVKYIIFPASKKDMKQPRIVQVAIKHDTLKHSQLWALIQLWLIINLSLGFWQLNSKKEVQWGTCLSSSQWSIHSFKKGDPPSF